MQQLNPAESKKRHNFAINFLARISVNNECSWNIFWSDEAHFTLDGAVNRQNSRIRPLLCMSVICIRICVWHGFTADFILGPFFSEQSTSQDPQRCSITSSRYCCLLQQYVIPALRER